jgi:Bacterial regulatory proteins, luxR family
MQNENLMAAIRRVAGGKVWLSTKMSGEILEAFSGGKPRRQVDSVHKLSAREFEVVQLLGDGKSTNHIADSLHINSGGTTQCDAFRTGVPLDSGYERKHESPWTLSCLSCRRVPYCLPSHGR